MNGKIAYLAIMAMVLSMLSNFTVLAEGFSVSSIYAERTFVEVNFSNPPTVQQNVSATLTKVKSGTTTVFNTGSPNFTFAANKLTIALDSPLDLDTVYKANISEGATTVTKYFKLTVLLSDDFNYANDTELQAKWKTIAGGAYQTTSVVTLDTANHRMLIPKSSTTKGFVSTDDCNLTELTKGNIVQNVKWTDYVLEYDAVIQDQLTPASNNVYFETSVRNNGTNRMYFTSDRLPHIRNNQLNIGYSDNFYDDAVGISSYPLAIGDQLAVRTSLRESTGKCTVNKTSAGITTASTLSTNKVSTTGGANNGGIGFKVMNMGVYIDNLRVYKFEEMSNVPASFEIVNWNVTRSIATENDLITIKFDNDVGKSTDNLDKITIKAGDILIPITSTTVDTDNKTVTITTNGHIQFDKVCEVNINNFVDATDLYSKSIKYYFRFKTLFADDFMYNNDEEIQAAWKSGSTSYPVRADTVNHAMILPPDEENGVQYIPKDYDSFTSWSNYTLEYDLKVIDSGANAGLKADGNPFGYADVPAYPKTYIMNTEHSLQKGWIQSINGNVGYMYIISNSSSNTSTDWVSNLKRINLTDGTGPTHSYILTGASKATSFIGTPPLPANNVIKQRLSFDGKTFETSCYNSSYSYTATNDPKIGIKSQYTVDENDIYNSNGAFLITKNKESTIAISNLKVYQFEKISGNVAIESSNITWAAGKKGVSGSVKLYNFSTGEDYPVSVIIGAYSADNKLLGVDTVDNIESLERNSNSFGTYNISGMPEAAAEIKIFAWNNINNIKPYCPTLSAR